MRQQITALVAPVPLVLLAGFTSPASADPIMFYTDQATFDTSTGATALSIPSSVVAFTRQFRRTEG